MHLILLVGIFGGFAAIGVTVYCYGRERKRFFESLSAFCRHLNTEISFSKNELARVIESYQHAYSKSFLNTLTGYKNLLDTKQDITHQTLTPYMWHRLRPEERSHVSEFFLNLGRHGAKEEIEKLESAHSHFTTLHQTAATRLKKEATLYLKLFIIMGIACVILLF
ncbi:MAG: hypothetical protein FWE31_03440 [Firmicutes bacterium]|nr:hypothetical protein [Bacillota bacterium]